MPLPPPSRNSTPDTNDSHPYVIKMEVKLSKMRQIMNSMFDLADTNLVLTDAKSGVNDFSLSHQFADKLDSLSKEVVNMGNILSEKASDVRDKVQNAQDRKRKLQDIQEICEVTDPGKKTKIMVTRSRYQPGPFDKTPTIKREVDSSDDENVNDDGTVSREIGIIYLGDGDGHFLFSKTNENDPEAHSFKCRICESIFRDRNELRNHVTHHKMEYYTCMLCNKVFRSVRSFDAHYQGHSVRHACTVCKQSFDRKSTLTNHITVHSTDKMCCSFPGCDRTFKHRGNLLEHVKWGHRDTKDVACTHCSKMFQTPSSMRAHRVLKHGYVEEITPGHPLAGTKQRKNPKPKPTESTSSSDANVKPKHFHRKNPKRGPTRNSSAADDSTKEKDQK